MTTEFKLGDEAYAIVWDPATGWDLYIPHLDEENDTLEETGASLVAAFMRLNSDPAFVTECLNWLETQAKEVDDGNNDKQE